VRLVQVTKGWTFFHEPFESPERKIRNLSQVSSGRKLVVSDSMDEQPRTDKRRRSVSEDPQSLAATPSAGKVYYTTCDGVSTLTSRTTFSFYDASVVRKPLLTHVALEIAAPTAPTHHVSFPEASFATSLVSIESCSKTSMDRSFARVAQIFSPNTAPGDLRLLCQHCSPQMRFSRARLELHGMRGSSFRSLSRLWQILISAPLSRVRVYRVTCLFC